MMTTGFHPAPEGEPLEVLSRGKHGPRGEGTGVVPQAPHFVRRDSNGISPPHPGPRAVIFRVKFL